MMRSKHGFTLVELLVAAGISVVILSAIGACLLGGINVWETAQNFNSSEMTASIGLSIMEDDLMNAFSYHDHTFSAREDAFSFAGIIGYQQEDNPNELGTIKYTYDSNRRAIYRQEMSGTDGNGQTPDQQEMIAEDVRDMTVAYLYMPDDASSGGAWSPARTEGTNFVRGVKLMLTIAEKDKMVNIERMIVLPMAHKSIGEE